MSYLGQFAVRANLQSRTWYTYSCTENTPTALKHFVIMATQSFPVPTHMILICKCFSARKVLRRPPTQANTFIYMLVESLKWNDKDCQKCLLYWGGLEPSMLPCNKTVERKLWSTFSRILL